MISQNTRSTLITVGVIFAFIGAILLSIMCQSCATISTYKGPVNPADFADWEMVNTFPAAYFGFVWEIRANPDPDAEVNPVAVMIDLFDGEMVFYQYWIGSEPYAYGFDDGEWEEVAFTPEERQGCLKCHPEKIGIESI